MPTGPTRGYGSGTANEASSWTSRWQSGSTATFDRRWTGSSRSTPSRGRRALGLSAGCVAHDRLTDGRIRVDRAAWLLRPDGGLTGSESLATAWEPLVPDPYGEFGVTVSVSHKAGNGETYYAGYYPYMYLTQDAAVFAGREPFGFPKKIAYIITQEHGGKEDDGYGGFGNDYFNFTLERRGYLIHTATGRYDDAELPAKPKFYGDPMYGRANLRLITQPDLKTTKWDLTYLPSEITEATAIALGRPETAGQHRFQLKPESIRTASARAIRSWALQATPFDNLGAFLPVKELIGLFSFNFDLIIPGAETIWTQTIERTAEDIGDLLFATPYQYTLRHRFPKPPGV